MSLSGNVWTMMAVQPDGSRTQRLTHRQYGSRTIRLDPDTFAPLGKLSAEPSDPSRKDKVEIGFPGMRAQRRAGLGHRSPQGGPYSLRWETLPPHRDRARTGPLPPPSWLTVWETRPA